MIEPVNKPKKITAKPVINVAVSFEKSKTLVWISTKIIASNIEIADRPFPKRDFLTLLIKKMPNKTAMIKTELMTR